MGEKIRMRRKELGLTLKDLGDAIGISESVVSRYESGEVKEIGISKLAKLCRILNVEYDYFLGDLDEDKSKENGYKQIEEELTRLNEFNKLIGGKIRDKREANGMTQVELANKIGYTKAGISNIEVGKRSMPLDKLKKLAIVLDMNMNSLLGITRNVDLKSEEITGMIFERISRLDLKERKRLLIIIENEFVNK